MKTCPACGASNADTAKFCNDCGKDLMAVLDATAVSHPDLADVKGTAAFAPRFNTRLQDLQAQRKADVLFVLDCTGSMKGEIDAIRDAITNFADTIATEGVRVRVGLIEFRDRFCQEEHRVLTFDSEPFTQDPVAFRQQVALLKAGGGGDEPESSLDALMLATRQPFEPGANKVIVLVTDAPPHIPDKDTQNIDEVVQALEGIQVDQLYLVIRTQQESSQIYLKLLAGRRGLAFDLGKGDDFRQRAEDFKKTLMALGKTISSATR